MTKNKSAPLFAGPIRVHSAGCFNGSVKATLSDDGGLVATQRQKVYGVLHPMRADREAFVTVETPRIGADLLRKLMEVARDSGHFRRYLSLRRAWLRAAMDQTK